MQGRDAGVVQRREKSRFPLETSEPFRIAGEGIRQNLDRHVATELGVAGAIHLAHGSGSDETAELVETEPRSWCERHERDVVFCPALGYSSAATRADLDEPVFAEAREAQAFEEALAVLRARRRLDRRDGDLEGQSGRSRTACSSADRASFNSPSWARLAASI